MKPFALAAVFFGATLPVLVAAPRNVEQGSTSSCISVAGASIWGGVGYNHVVYLTNACQQAYDCTVTTDVDPEPQRARVPATTTVQVVTALNSPARVFVPTVSCEAAE